MRQHSAGNGARALCRENEGRAERKEAPFPDSWESVRQEPPTDYLGDLEQDTKSL